MRVRTCCVPPRPPPPMWYSFFMLKTRAFTPTTEPHAEEDGYLVFFPALRGCHSWGTTYEEAVKNAEEVLTGYLEGLQINGERIPDPS
jgi:predicted RNase H-like HicB family nuclease